MEGDATLEIKIQARDEASASFRTIGQRLHEINMEARASGEKDIERLLKGGGAFGLASYGAELVKKSADAAREAINGLAAGTTTWGDATQKTLENLPIFGKFYEAGESLVNVAGDGTAAFLKWAGASDSLSNYFKTNDSIIQEANEDIKLQIKFTDELESLHRKIRDVGATSDQKARDKAKDDLAKESEKIAALREEAKKKPKEEQFALNAAANSAEEAAKKLHDATIAQLDKQAMAADYERISKHQQSIDDLKSEGRQRQLALSGQTAEAEKEQALRTLNDANAAAEAKGYKERLPYAYGDEHLKAIGEIESDEKKAAREKYDSDVAAIEKRRGDERVAMITAQEEQLADQKAEARQKDLDAQGKHLDAELLQIDRGYEKQRAQLEKQFKEMARNETAEERKRDEALKQQRLDTLASLEKSEQAAAREKYAEKKPEKENERKELATLQESRSLTGVAQASLVRTTNIPQQQLQEARESRVALQQTVNHLATLIKQLDLSDLIGATA